MASESRMILEALAVELDLSAEGFALSECAEVAEAKYLVVLRSTDLSLRVLYDRGGLELGVGAPGAPATWEDAVGARRVWFHPHYIVKFMKNDDHVDVRRGLQEIGSSSREEVLSEWRAFLAEGLPNLKAFFLTGPSDEALNGLELFRSRLNRIKREQIKDLFGQ